MNTLCDYCDIYSRGFGGNGGGVRKIQRFSNGFIHVINLVDGWWNGGNLSSSDFYDISKWAAKLS